MDIQGKVWQGEPLSRWTKKPGNAKLCSQRGTLPAFICASLHNIQQPIIAASPLMTASSLSGIVYKRSLINGCEIPPQASLIIARIDLSSQFGTFRNACFGACYRFSIGAKSFCLPSRYTRMNNSFCKHRLTCPARTRAKGWARGISWRWQQ